MRGKRACEVGATPEEKRLRRLEKRIMELDARLAKLENLVDEVPNVIPPIHIDAIDVPGDDDA